MQVAVIIAAEGVRDLDPGVRPDVVDPGELSLRLLPDKPSPSPSTYRASSAPNSTPIGLSKTIDATTFSVVWATPGALRFGWSERYTGRARSA